MNLTASEAGSFQHDGYLHLARPLVSQADVVHVRQLVEPLFEESPRAGVARHDLGDGANGLTVAEVLSPSNAEPRLLRSAVFRESERWAQVALGTRRVRLRFDHAIFKPRRSGGVTAWHQDVAFDPDADVPTATVWFALYDADVDNGCMMFVPGSNRGPVLEHRDYGPRGRQAVDPPLDGAVSCPVPAGGATVHGQRTLHASGPNTSERDRLAWIMKFVVDDSSLPKRLARRHVRREP